MNIFLGFNEIIGLKFKEAIMAYNLFDRGLFGIIFLKGKSKKN
jgi:hypothetical protein